MGARLSRTDHVTGLQQPSETDRKYLRALGRVAADIGPVSPGLACEPSHENDLSAGPAIDKVGFMSGGGVWIDGFLDWLRAGGVTPDTLRVRKSYVTRWIAAVEDPATATASDVASFLAVPDWKPNTRRAARATLRVFYHWATETGLVATDPTKGIRPVNVPRALPRPAPESAIVEALEMADEECRLMVLLAAYAGLRRGEIARLHADDIGNDSIVVHGKGGHLRRVPTHAKLRGPLEAARLRGGWVFPSPVRKGEHVNVDYIGRRLGRLLPDGFSGHTLRHRFGTQVYRGTHDIRATQELLGHASVATTQRYVEVSDDALLAAVSSL